MQGMLIYRKSLSESLSERDRARATAIPLADHICFYRRVAAMRNRGRLIPAYSPAHTLID